MRRFRSVVSRRAALTVLLLASFGSTVAFSADAPAAKRAITVDDLSRLRDVSDPQRSPDGAWVAYTVRSVDVEKDSRDNDIWMARWDGSEEIRVTSSAENETDPRWSPDGKYLAFLASRGDDDEKKKGSQVWLLRRAGGEAVKLTDFKGGVDDLVWSPDSSRLALVVSDYDASEDPEKLEGWMRKTAPPIVLDRYHFKEDREGYLRGLYSHIALFDLATKTLTPLTSGAVNDEDPAWSPDGRTIAFRSKRAHEDPDRTENSDLFSIAAEAGAAPRQLTTTKESETGRPAWSPDGSRIAILVGDEDKFYAYDLAKLALVPATGGAPQILTAALDRPVSTASWTADGKSLVFSVEDDRAAWIGRVGAAGGTVEALSSGRRVVVAPSLGGAEVKDGGIAVVASTSTEPDEIRALENGKLRPLSHQNDKLRDELAFSRVDDLTSRSKDGTVVHGLITRPANAVEGRRYPTLLYIHGGPNGQDDYSFRSDRELLAASGYVVLEINYRGSSGRGAAYQKAIFANWGDKEVQDLLGAVDEAVRMGVADPDRLGLGGWSYGGILTNYVIASDTRFKAAVSGASSSLQTTMYGVDQYIVQYDNEMGQPWKTKDLWTRVSYPFYRADKIKTPTLFLCGQIDFNVPIAGVEQMYQALRSLKLDTELVIYPGQYHGLTVPSYQRDRVSRFLGWWGKYLKPEAPANPGLPAVPQESAPKN
ncbi:MAG: S9 family peptidase [Thermoanaerobaculia bacterium]